MLEQVSTSVKFLAFFTASKTGKTGLTVTIDIYDPSGSQIVTGGSATAIGGGLYAYTLSTNNSAEGEYAAIFKTTDSTVDSQHIPSLWVLGRAGVENLDAAVSSRSTLTAAQVNAEADTALADVGLTTTITGRIDQAISTRLAAADYTAPTSAPTVTAIRQEMDSNSTKLANLDATVSSRLATSGYTAPSAAPTVAAIRTEMDSNSTKLANLDATVSSRLATSGYTAPPTPPTAAANATAVRTELATELARVDVATSSRLAAADYTAPSAAPTVAAIRTEMDSNSTKLANLDATVSSRLAGSAYTAPSNSDVTAIKAKTDLLETTRLAQCSTVATTGAQIAAALS